jgi:hypothetical protein
MGGADGGSLISTGNPTGGKGRRRYDGGDIDGDACFCIRPVLGRQRQADWQSAAD